MRDENSAVPPCVPENTGTLTAITRQNVSNYCYFTAAAPGRTSIINLRSPLTADDGLSLKRGGIIYFPLLSV